MIFSPGRRFLRPELDFQWVSTLALASALALQTPLLAQGLKREEAIEAIIGSDVETEETDAQAATARIVAAIGNAAANAESVRKTFSLDKLDITFVPDLDESRGPVAEAIAKHKRDIVLLREAIEGSALFYHAVDSRSILLRDVVALEYADNGAVTIFVKGKPNGTGPTGQ